jgi:hypothetical protein
MTNIYTSGFEFIPAYPISSTAQYKFASSATDNAGLSDSALNPQYTYIGVSFLLGMLAGFAIHSYIVQSGGMTFHLPLNTLSQNQNKEGFTPQKVLNGQV